VTAAGGAVTLGSFNSMCCFPQGQLHRDAWKRRTNSLRADRETLWQIPGTISKLGRIHKMSADSGTYPR